MQSLHSFSVSNQNLPTLQMTGQNGWIQKREKKKQTIDVGVISMDFKITMINLLKKQVTGFHALIKISWNNQTET